jgi:hypothetical protein
MRVGMRAIHYGAVPAEATGITGTCPLVVERNEGFEDDYGGDGDGLDKDLRGTPRTPTKQQI